MSTTASTYYVGTNHESCQGTTKMCLPDTTCLGLEEMLTTVGKYGSPRQVASGYGTYAAPIGPPLPPPAWQV